MPFFGNQGILTVPKQVRADRTDCVRTAYRSGGCGSSGDLLGWLGSRVRGAMSCCVMLDRTSEEIGNLVVVLGDRHADRGQAVGACSALAGRSSARRFR